MTTGVLRPLGTVDLPLDGGGSLDRVSVPGMPDTELVPFPTTGRVHEMTFRVGPGATTPLGRTRLDTLVDWLQQVAYEDVLDAGLEAESLWIARRTRLEVSRFPAFGERLTVRTACSGIGALVAERRTSFAGELGAAVEATALWVPLDPESLRPRKTPRFLAVYGPSAGDHKVRARLRHPQPPADAASSPWRFVAADLDVAAHVNNAAYWRAIEDELGSLTATTPLTVELEHHTPAFVGEARLVRDGDRRWLTDPDGQVFASALLGAG